MIRVGLSDPAMEVMVATPKDPGHVCSAQKGEMFIGPQEFQWNSEFGAGSRRAASASGDNAHLELLSLKEKPSVGLSKRAAAGRPITAKAIDAGDDVRTYPLFFSVVSF